MKTLKNKKQEPKKNKPDSRAFTIALILVQIVVFILVGGIVLILLPLGIIAMFFLALGA
jgi:small-conductance mechanosensitive channel